MGTLSKKNAASFLGFAFVAASAMSMAASGLGPICYAAVPQSATPPLGAQLPDSAPVSAEVFDAVIDSVRTSAAAPAPRPVSAASSRPTPASAMKATPSPSVAHSPVAAHAPASAASPMPRSEVSAAPTPTASSVATPSSEEPHKSPVKKPQTKTARVPKIDKAPIKARSSHSDSAAVSSTASSSRSLPPLLKDVETKYAQAATLEAKFTQVNEVAAMGTQKTSSGHLMVKRPNKLRWETTQPDMNLLVSDGRKFWFYTPPFDEGERGQVIERRSNEINSRLANALLSGHFSVARDMKIRAEGSSRYILTPKPGSAGTVKQAEIEIDPSKMLIQKVVLEHQGGNRSEITLSNIELGKPMGDEAFIFTPPPNTDRVTQ